MQKMLVVGAALAAAAMPDNARAQAPQMSAVQFPRGASSVTLTGRVGEVGRVYTFRARQGQTIAITTSSPTGAVGANLMRYPGEAGVADTDGQGRLRVRAPATGGYLIYLYSGGGRGATPYTLTLSVR